MPSPAQTVSAMPSLFISHGAPNIVLSDLPARRFLDDLASGLPGRPRAIIVASAHFEHPGVAVVTDPAPGMIRDFSGFGEKLERMVYPAPGSPQVATEAMTLLGNAGLRPVAIPKRGYDHGTWNPLYLAFPDADIPVVQISVDPSRDARHHFSIGKALAPLAQDGVLIVGSGHITHNLRGFFQRGRDQRFDAALDLASTEFVAWVEGNVASGDIEALLDWEAKAPHAALNHPEVEHFLPFFVALGAGGGQGVRLHHSVQAGFFAYDHYAFGATAA
jgi:4,5-DOPA dioxygenase extradiol